MLNFLWYAIVMVQFFLLHGTAYKLTKRGGDNGAALFGWLIVMRLAALVPGLGIYLWLKYRDAQDTGEIQNVENLDQI